MLGLGKKREFLLKLFLGGLFLLSLSFIGWGFIWVGLILIICLSTALHYLSTNWLLKKLDLGPDTICYDEMNLSVHLENLSTKYEINKPIIHRTKISGPFVIGLGDKKTSYLVISESFFNKLTNNEKDSLLEIAIHKIESDFCKNIEFITHLNFFLLFCGAKLDLILAFVLGLKKNKNPNSIYNLFFSRISILLIRFINYFYMNKKVFTKFDEITYQNNPHLILALNKTIVYSPIEEKTLNPLLSPFNFCNFPSYLPWQKSLNIHPKIEMRLFELQKDKNLMLESLTI